MNKKPKHFEPRLLILAFIIIGAYFFFYQSIYNIVLRQIINTFFNITKESFFGDFFFSVLFLGSFAYIIVRIVISNWKPRFNELIIPGAILLFYIPHRIGIPGQHWMYLNFQLSHYIYYSDSVIFLLIAIFFRPSIKFIPGEMNNSLLIEDNTYKLVGDVFRREEYSGRIAGLINNHYPNNSFAIAVTGHWGSGKSVFLDLLFGKIQNSIPIKFNPWLSKPSSNSLEDFFMVVAESLHPYDGKLSNKFKEYAITLFSLEEKIGVKIFNFFGLQKEGNNFQSLEKKKAEIKDLMKEHKIKLVFFIDDLDRLSAEEALSVLSLIRNSFDFPNVIFVVAFDHEYILKLLDEKKVPNPNLFLDKIFQMDLDLPAFPPSLIKIQLINLLCKGKNDTQQMDIKTSIDVIDKRLGLENIITNLRECIRLINSFNHVFDKKYSQVDLTDYLLIEILKLKWKLLYQEIRDGLSITRGTTYLNFPKDDILETKIVKFDVEIYKQFDKNENDKGSEILELLFNRKMHIDEEKAVRVVGNSIRYFSDQLFGAIDFTAFDVYKSQADYNPYKQFLDKSLSEGQKSELFEIMLRITHFNSVGSFYNFCKGILFFCNKTNEYHLTSTIFNLTQDNISLAGKDEFIETIYKILEPDVFPYFAESLLGGEILKGFYGGIHFLNNELDKEKLKAILKTNLDRFVKEANGYDSRVLIIHKQIFDRVDDQTQKVHIDPQVNEIVCNYLSKFKEQYLNTDLIVEAGNHFVLEAFTSEIFTWDGFEKLLLNSPENFQTLQLKSFYLTYKKNNYQPIPFDKNKTIILCDPSTKFEGSDDYPSLAPGESVIREQKKYLSDAYEIFKEANWIAHARELTMEQAIKGGTYKFVKQFSLANMNRKIKSAILYFMVDDAIIVVINGNTDHNEFVGHEKSHQLDLSKYILPGLNEIQFTIKNSSFTMEGLNENPANNPYDFIYTLVIEFENP